MSAPYAQLSDLTARWPQMPSDSATQNSASVLLGDASYWLRQWFPTETAQIDASQADGTGARILVCSMVKRALINAENLGVRQDGQTMGPLTETRVFSNPDGNLYITDAEITLIKGGGRVRSVRLGGTGSDTAGAFTWGSVSPGPTLYPQLPVWPPFPYLPPGP